MVRFMEMGRPEEFEESEGHTGLRGGQYANEFGALYRFIAPKR